MLLTQPQSRPLLLLPPQSASPLLRQDEPNLPLHEVATKMMQHLLVGAGVATQEEVASMYEQAMIQLQGEDFCGITDYHTILARKP